VVCRAPILYVSSVSDFQWATVIAELEREFAKRELRDHLRSLARLKAGYERQVVRLGGMPRPPWTTERIVELASVFQVAPFADRYPVAARDGLCPHCRANLRPRDGIAIRAVIGERTLLECKRCDGRWLVFESSRT